LSVGFIVFLLQILVVPPPITDIGFSSDVQSIALPKLGFFFLTSNITTRTRVLDMMKYWGDRVRHHPAVSDFVFASIEDPAFAHLPSIDVFPRYSALSAKYRDFRPDKVGIGIQLIIKDIFVMDYCVHNTSADWCFRLMDDLYVNEAAFDDFVTWIALHPNPRTTPYMLGNCLLHKDVDFYLQGGSGYCFSRNAAERIVAVADEWIPKIDLWEDFYITKFIKSVGVRSETCDSPYFSGHFIRWALWGRWNWTSAFVDNCPQSLPKEKFCDHQLVPVKKLVFIHSLKYWMTQERWANWMAAVPNNAMIYYVESAPTFCFGQPDQIAAWNKRPSWSPPT
jgi:hypothetical protein